MSRDGRHLFTSESVTEGHPDKIADQISDSVLDALLAQDPKSRVACETLVTTGLVVMAGEITTNAIVDFQEVARDDHHATSATPDADIGFDADTCARAVVDSQPVARHRHGRRNTGGAGDQGLMFGYACTTPTSSCRCRFIAGAPHREGARRCARRDGVLDYLRPDGKSQVTVEYDGRKPVRVDTVVVSTQHERRRDERPRCAATSSRRSSTGRAGRFDGQRNEDLSHQPHRPVRRRRPARRLPA